MATVIAGEELFVSWMGNGHVNNGQSDGTCVHLMFADFASDPDFGAFRDLPGGECISYWHWDAQRAPETNTLIRIPANTPEGKHTLLWYWDFTDFWYASCADIEVLPQGSELPTTTAPGRSLISTSSSPNPPPSDSNDVQIMVYLSRGCADSNVGDPFCLAYIGA